LDVVDLDDLAGDSSGGTVDQKSVLVDDIDDDGKLVLVGGSVHDDDTSDLNETAHPFQEGCPNHKQVGHEGPLTQPGTRKPFCGA